MTNEQVQAAAKQIDEYYDSMLYCGMPMEQARWVEQQREAAHAELRREVMGAMLSGWR